MYYIVYIEELNEYYIVTEWEITDRDEIIAGPYAKYTSADNNFNGEVVADQEKYWL